MLYHSHPVVEQEGDPSDQKGNAAHHGISKRGAKGDHEDPDPEARRGTKSAGMFLREEEIHKAAEYANENCPVRDHQHKGTGGRQIDTAEEMSEAVPIYQ